MRKTWTLDIYYKFISETNTKSPFRNTFISFKKSMETLRKSTEPLNNIR